MGNRKKLVKSVFPLEFGKSVISELAWNLVFQTDFYGKASQFSLNSPFCNSLGVRILAGQCLVLTP